VRLRLSQGESLKPDESEGCSPVSGGITIQSDFARLGRPTTTLLPRFDPKPHFLAILLD
jgi:hypothetical protein